MKSILECARNPIAETHFFALKSLMIRHIRPSSTHHHVSLRDCCWIIEPKQSFTQAKKAHAFLEKNGLYGYTMANWQEAIKDPSVSLNSKPRDLKPKPGKKQSRTLP